MASQGDEISDAELHRRLMELGCNVGPITDTTRKLYLKKFKKLSKDSGVSDKTTNGKQLDLGFSSDDTDVESPVKSVHSSRYLPKNAEFKEPALRNRKSLRKSRASSQSLSTRSSTSNGNSKQISKSNNLSYDMNISDSDTDSIKDKLTLRKSRRKSTRKEVPTKVAHDLETKDHVHDQRDILSTSSGTHYQPRTSTPTKNSSFDLPENLSSSNRPPSYQNDQNMKSVPLNGHKYEPPEISEHFATEESSKITLSNCPQKIASFFLFVAIIFFIVISFVYVMGTNQWNVNILDTHVKSAPKINISEIKGICDSIDCVHPDNANNAIQCCHKLFEELSVIAGEHDCNESSDIKAGNLTKRQVLELIKSYDILSSRSDMNLLNDALILLMKNKNWGIELMSKEYETNLIFPEEVWWLKSKFPLKSLRCRIIQSSFNMLNKLFVLVFLVTSLCICYKVFIMYRKRQEIYKRHVFSMAEEIIETVKRYHAECKDSDIDPYIPIPHVRDMIIPLADRVKLKTMWEDACALVEDNESRIRVEYREVACEDCKVWCWLEKYSPETNSKVWQGRAFENDHIGLNASPYTSTYCLKIRNMFSPDSEKNDGWKTAVIDAVIEKCGDHHEIVHIAIANDASVPEGCVYVKFRSREAAGRAYKNLHGFWFDGKLVTVKFLRLERYYEHYPEAQSLNSPLKPSNDLKLSLAYDDTFSSGGKFKSS